MEQMRAEEQQRRIAGRPGPSASPAAGGQDESYWAYMQRQVQERTEKLNVMGDSMDKLEENSSNWANDVSKYVNQQKRKVVLGGKSPARLTSCVEDPLIYEVEADDHSNWE